MRHHCLSAPDALRSLVTIASLALSLSHCSELPSLPFFGGEDDPKALAAAQEAEAKQEFSQQFTARCEDPSYQGDGRRTIKAIQKKYDRATCEATAEFLATTKELHLYGLDIVNLKPIQGMPNLAYLDISANPIRSFRDIKSFPRLTTLIAKELPATATKGIERITGLKTLILQGSPIADIRSLCEFSSLEKLDLRDPGSPFNRDLNGFPCIFGHSDLNTLYLSQMRVRHPKTLAGLAKLKSLTLDNVGLVNLNFINDSFKGLRFLAVDRNNLLSLKGIDKLPDLEIVSFEDNRIRDIRPLHKLAQLYDWLPTGNPLKKTKRNCPRRAKLPQPIADYCAGKAVTTARSKVISH